MQVVEMRMLRLTAGVAIRAKNRNKYARVSLGISEEKGMRWLGHIVRRDKDHITNKIKQYKERGKASEK